MMEPARSISGKALHTIYSDCDSLGQFVAICSNKRWDFAQLIDLEVVGGDAFCGLSVDDIEIKLVLLSHGFDSRGSRITLSFVSVLVVSCALQDSQERYIACRMT